MKPRRRAARCKVFKQVRATDLWRRMLTMLFETGHPWITFKDPCNMRSPQRHVGVVHSSNLCTEITLNTSDDEVAVCNLGSVNLANHVGSDGLDHDQAGAHGDDGDADARQRHRHQFLHHPGGAPLEPASSPGRARPDGLSGRAADLRIPLRLRRGGAVRRREHGGDLLPCDLGLGRSCRRARPLPSFEGSLWSKGVLPINSIELLAEARGGARSRPSIDARLGRVCANGSKPSACAIPTRWRSRRRRRSPTSAACPSRSSPTYQNLFVKSNMSGDFTVVNELLVRDLKARGLWDEVMVVGSEIFRRQRRTDRPHPGRSQGALRHRVRDRQRLADRSGRAPAEMDRPVAVAQSLHRQPVRQEARCALSSRLEARAEDHLLFAVALGDPCREIDAQRHGRQAQRRVGCMRRSCTRSISCRRRRRSGRRQGLPDRRSRLRSLPVRQREGHTCSTGQKRQRTLSTQLAS